MSNSKTLTEGKVGIFSYTLSNTDGDLIDSSGEEGPVAYLHGAENIVVGLERELEGKAVGAHIKVEISAEDGYGEVGDGEVMAVERNTLPEDAEIFPGLMLAAEDDDGNDLPVWVTSVEENVFYVTTDHPLAGMILVYELTIEDIRDATADELVHGHPHGIDGEHCH